LPLGDSQEQRCQKRATKAMTMTTTRMRSTVVTSFRSVAFHAMSSGDNGWSLDDRLRAASSRRPGWQVVRRRALAFVCASVHGAGDVACVDWRASTQLGDVGSSRDGRRSCSGGRAGDEEVRRRRDGQRSAEAAVAEISTTTLVRRESTVKCQELFCYNRRTL